ncbi:glutaminyl-peptide cyclotransferase [Nonlabens xiamenensis]|uniref:glutaminyl-peptide cyclotransferase n=1 Tax=Nonlabens xiamenensis TaxID=2341043 RepID=UPI000F60EC01|nr:glutaminyl-peptide cyclotransferase [Nonlabens xiamenensis]
MNWRYSLSLVLAALSLSACKTEIDRFKDNYALEINNPKSSWSDTDSVELSLTDESSMGVDSVVWTQNAARIDGASGVSLSRKLTNQPLGKLTFKAKVYKDGMSTTVSASIKRLSNIKPKIYNYRIINTYPHPTESYTQGLEFHEDKLYESTGQFKESDVRITDVETGETLKKVELPLSQFAEGLTILDNKVYQLTWKSRMAYIYDLELNPIGDFAYNESKEGWGLTNDGQYLYKSDGTSKIWKIDPVTFRELGYIEVVDNQQIYKKINELEWIDGKIYANVYQENLIFIIDPSSGAVEAAINLNSLVKQVPEFSGDDNVLNGIAYDKMNNRLFVTGKRWSKMFEIEILR